MVAVIVRAVIAAELSLQFGRNRHWSDLCKNGRERLFERSARFFERLGGFASRTCSRSHSYDLGVVAVDSNRSATGRRLMSVFALCLHNPFLPPSTSIAESRKAKRSPKFNAFLLPQHREPVQAPMTTQRCSHSHDSAGCTARLECQRPGCSLAFGLSVKVRPNIASRCTNPGTVQRWRRRFPLTVFVVSNPKALLYTPDSVARA